MSEAERGPATIRLRAGRPGDLDALLLIETTAFQGDRLNRRSLRYYLGAPTTDTLVALSGKTVAGYAMVGFRRRSKAAWLFSLAVSLDFPRRGAGRTLLAGCETAAARRGCRSLQLEVRVDNPAAIALYEGAGYRQFGTIDDYYEDGTTAIRYDKAVAS